MRSDVLTQIRTDRSHVLNTVLEYRSRCPSLGEMCSSHDVSVDPQFLAAGPVARKNIEHLRIEADNIRMRS